LIDCSTLEKVKAMRTRLSVLSTMFIFFVVATPSLARYVPRLTTQPISSRITPGRYRGNCPNIINNSRQPFKILAPKNPVGQTASLYPTFAWQLPEGLSDNVDIELSLFRYEEGSLNREPLVKERMPADILQWTLPNDRSGLLIGETYLWRVVLRCNQSNPSVNPQDFAEFQVNQLSIELREQINETSDTDMKADLYAESGFWYDAFSLASEDLRQSFLRDLERIDEFTPKSQSEQMVPNNEDASFQ
jgi:hypothetical protein